MDGAALGIQQVRDGIKRRPGKIPAVFASEESNAEKSSKRALGAHRDRRGTNFSVFSEVAKRVFLCLFDEDGVEHRVRLPQVTAFCWHAYVPGVGPGQRYGFRVEGPWAPPHGHRCNSRKLLLDPYARAIAGSVKRGSAVLPFVVDHPDEPSPEDSAAGVPRSIVVDPGFDWGDDRPLRTPLHESVIYEVHVKGFTARMAEVFRVLRARCHSK